jgi:hypothetical protein
LQETASPDDADSLWRARVADAARLAAEELAKEDVPHLRSLRSDLEDLHRRLTAGHDGDLGVPE